MKTRSKTSQPLAAAQPQPTQDQYRAALLKRVANLKHDQDLRKVKATLDAIESVNTPTGFRRKHPPRLRLRIPDT